MKSEQRRFSSDVRKSAIEVRLQRETLGGVWRRVMAFLTPISNPLQRDKTSGRPSSLRQTLAKFSPMEGHSVFDVGESKRGFINLICTGLRSLPNIRHSRAGVGNFLTGRAIECLIKVNTIVF